MLLLAHNFYRSQSPSGEDLVVTREMALLQAAVSGVTLLTRHSDDLATAGIWARVRLARDLAGSPARVDTLAAAISACGCSAVHAHNLWPSLTLDLALAAQARGTPLLITLHNDRLIATNRQLVIDGYLRRPRTAEEALHAARLSVCHPSFLNEWAYRRALRHWWRRQVPQTAVDAYLVFTEHQRARCIRAGLPADRLVVKPNAVSDPGCLGTGPGEYVVLVGRLSAEKGIAELASSWTPDLPPLRVVGDGPLRPLLDGRANIACLGRLPGDAVAQVMAKARFLLLMARSYEGFPLVLPEAFACGTPCLVPDLGGMPGIVRDGVCGRVFRPGDGSDLRSQVQRLWDEAPSLRAACRAEYLAKYTPERNLTTLLAIYDNVIHRRHPDTGIVPS